MAQAQQLKDQGKPYEIGFTAAQYEGYVVNINNLITALRRQDRQRGQHRAGRRRQDRAGADLAAKARAPPGLTSSSLSNAQEPEVFADLQNGRSAFS